MIAQQTKHQFQNVRIAIESMSQFGEAALNIQVIKKQKKLL